MQNQQPLKVGDRVYNERQQRYGTNIYYTFAAVVRVTKTQAILDNGKKLVNEPKRYFGDKQYSFGEYGNKYECWYIETPEVIEKATVENHQQSVNRWFDAKQFTQEEKELIYSIFQMSEEQLKQLMDFKEVILEMVK